MASIFKKTYTKPVPQSATIESKGGKRVATWKHRGKNRKAEVTTGQDGSDRIIVEAKTWTAKYRDGNGIIVEFATGCRDKQAAQAVLNDLVQRAELVRSGIITNDQDRMSERQHETFETHFASYLDYHRAKGTSQSHVDGIRIRLDRLVRECDIKRLSDITHDRIERWLSTEAKAGKSPRTRNSYLQAVQGFCNWCVDTNRQVANPVAKVSKADERSAKRRQRRALTEDEIGRLLFVAKHRPLAEYGRTLVLPAVETNPRKRTKEPLTFESLPEAL
ncbi:MAG: hypothetical protein KDA87_15185, partial [Planctomycetales bacterium]|nr:hypothetical protein [Planctomycetales bacterium]